MADDYVPGGSRGVRRSRDARIDASVYGPDMADGGLPGVRRDLALAAGVVVLVLGGAATAPTDGRPLDLLGYLLPVVGALALAGRRRAPVPVLCATAALLLAYEVRDYAGVTARTS